MAMMNSKKITSWWSRKNLIPMLIAFAMCYQLLYNIILMGAVEKDERLERQNECQAVSGSGTMTDSPHCLEVRLFRSWHEEDIGLLQSAGSSGSDEFEADEFKPIAVEVAGIHEFGAQVEASQLSPELIATRESGNKSDIDSVADQLAEIEKRHDLMDKLEQKIRISLSEPSNMTPWAQSLVDLQSHLKSEMASHDATHTAIRQKIISHEAAHQAIHESKTSVERLANALGTSVNSSYGSPWAKDLTALQQHLGSELNSSTAAKHARHVAQQSSLNKELAERMTHLEQHMAGLASKRKTWESELLTKYGAPAASTTRAQNSFLAKRLQWSNVKAWSKTSWQPKSALPLFMSGKANVALRKDLRHMHWSATIPKAACITAIQSSAHTKARMMYFINNFRLQDYEGPRELVLVYELADTEAAELVRKYADGFYIKGVAARGLEFPSTDALRYGAWSSDADVVAQWDFDEWHDPSRLSMQIRAMAMTSRPACMIQPPHEVDKNGSSKVSPIASSLAGERSWMEKYWHPHLEGGKDMDPTSIVELDMQHDQLARSIDSIQQEFGTSSEHKPEVHVEAAHAWNMTECLAFDPWNNATASDEHRLEEDVGQSVGHEARRQFHKLMRKRHGITENLQLLCMQSATEFDDQKQVFLRQHVDRMVSARNGLDEHIATIRGLFGMPLS